MTDDRIALCQLVEKSSDADLLREMIGFAAERAAWLDDEQIDEREVVEALQQLDPLWDQLFPAEQARILQLLVARVKVRLDGLAISLRVEGIGSLVDDLRLREAAEQRAA